MTNEIKIGCSEDFRENKIAKKVWERLEPEKILEAYQKYFKPIPLEDIEKARKIWGNNYQK